MPTLISVWMIYLSKYYLINEIFQSTWITHLSVAMMQRQLLIPPADGTIHTNGGIWHASRNPDPTLQVMHRTEAIAVYSIRPEIPRFGFHFRNSQTRTARLRSCSIISDDCSATGRLISAPRPILR